VVAERGRVNLPPIGPLYTDPQLEPTRQRRLAARAARGDAAAAAWLRPAEAAASAGNPALATASKPGAPATPAPTLRQAALTAPALAAVTTPEPTPLQAQVSAPVPAAGSDKAPASPRFTLATRLLRTSAEAEQLQVAMRTLLAVSAGGAAQVQRVAVGDDWRVMGGPFDSRAAAERARAHLLARGVRTEVATALPEPVAISPR
jgi:hypothetical protein